MVQLVHFRFQRTLITFAKEGINYFLKVAAVTYTDVDSFMSGVYKWLSNHPKLLQNTNISEHTFDEHAQQISVKSLGMFWKPQAIHFVFKLI